MNKILLLILVLSAFSFADTYKLHLDTDGTEGTVTIDATDSVSFVYQHSGVAVPTGPVLDATGYTELDSLEIHAVDAAGNAGGLAWIYVKLVPVNDNAPSVASDTLVCLEGGNVNFTPVVTDLDN